MLAEIVIRMAIDQVKRKFLVYSVDLSYTCSINLTPTNLTAILDSAAIYSNKWHQLFLTVVF